MRFLSMFAAALMAASFAACAGTAQPLPTVTQSLPAVHGAQRAQGAGTLYVAEAGSNQIVAYDLGTDQIIPNLTISLPSMPRDVAVDSTGLLYVSLVASNEVRVYSGTTLQRSISTPNPGGLAVDARDNLYVMAAGGTGRTVGVYHPGSSSPFRTITENGAFYMYGGIVVHNDDVFFSVTNGAGGIVQECRLTVNSCRITQGFSAYPGGVAFDAQGDVVTAGAGTLIWFGLPGFKQIQAQYFGVGQAIEFVKSDAAGNLYVPINGGSKNPSKIVEMNGYHASTIISDISYPMAVAVSP